MLNDGSQKFSQTLSSQCYLHRGHFYQSNTLIADLLRTRTAWAQIVEDNSIACIEGQSCALLNNDKKSDWINHWSKQGLSFHENFDKSFSKTNENYSEFIIDAHWIDGADLLKKYFQKFYRSTVFGKFEKTIEGTTQVDVFYSNENGLNVIRTDQIILAAGTGNANAIRKTGHICDIEPQQNRQCQVLVIAGKLPNISVIVPTDGLFIVPAIGAEEVRWQCTYGTDEVSHHELGRPSPVDPNRIKDCLSALEKVFPWLSSASPALQFGCYPAWKAESAQDGQGKRPDSYSILEVTARVTAIYPTKLTLAPLVAKKITGLLVKKISASMVEELQFQHKSLTLELVGKESLLEQV
jgi:hypothetical protein